MIQASSRRECHDRAARNLPRIFSKNIDILRDFICVRADQHQIEQPDLGDPSTPLACSFSKAYPNLVAVADEDGGILILDSFKIGINAIKQDWRAHKNAIFDIDWTPGENKLLTASGDQTIQHVDVEVEEVISTFKGHLASVKTVRCCDNPNIFATGARDGHVMIWDDRVTAKGGFLPPVNTIYNAHGMPQQIGSAAKKRTPKAQQKSSQHTVTAVVFQDDQTLISSGCVDGSLKVWDLRKTYSNLKQEPIPFHKFVYNGNASRTHGFSSLILDETRTRLFANCRDDTIYMYDCAGLSKDPVASYKGHMNSSFYVKMSLSPDDLYLLSGSSNGHGYIWKVNEPRKKPLVLNCHSEEISGVAWSPIDHTTLLTLSDDCSICTWRAVRPDYLDLWKSKVNEALGYVVGTAEWMPEVKECNDVATPQRSGLVMWNTPERPTTPSLSTRSSTRSPLVEGVAMLAPSPDIRERPGPSGTSLNKWLLQPRDNNRPPLLSPVKAFGRVASPQNSPKQIHVLLSPRKTPIPGCFDALSPRKTLSLKTSLGSASRSVKRKLSELSGSGNQTDDVHEKKLCQGLRKESNNKTPLKTPKRISTPSKTITPNQKCVQNLRYDETPDKIKQSPTVNLPNYVLNPTPRTPRPLTRSDSLKENSAVKGKNWLVQLSKQKREDNERASLKEDTSPQDITNKPGANGPSLHKGTPGAEKLTKSGVRTMNTPKSLRKNQSTPKSSRKAQNTPKSSRKPQSNTPSSRTPSQATPKLAAENQSVASLKKEVNGKELIQTPRSSQGSSVKRRGATVRLSTAKTPTATRRSILSYFSPQDKGKQSQ